MLALTFSAHSARADLYSAAWPINDIRGLRQFRELAELGSLKHNSIWP